MNTDTVANANALPAADVVNVIQEWTQRLESPDAVVVEQAAQQLSRIGHEIATVLPRLAQSSLRTTGVARARAASELGVLGMRLLAAIPRVRDALRAIILTDGNEEVRTSAIHALAQLGPVGASQVPALVHSLRDPLSPVRAGAAQDLAALGAEARDSVPALISSCLHDAALEVRVHAGVALWRVGRRLHPAQASIVEGLRSNDPLLCWIAAECLGEMGSEAAEAVPALLDALRRKPVPLIATTIMMALEHIDPNAAKAATPA